VKRTLLQWRALALTRKDGFVLLERQDGRGLFAGLWDLPRARPAGIRVHGAIASRGVVEQTLTHREVRVCVEAARASGTPVGTGLRWVAPDGLAALGLSSLARKSLRAAGVLTEGRPSRTLRAP
jgi:adenine-specific DNA glycosylase